MVRGRRLRWTISNVAKPAALPYHSGMNEELEKLVQQARPGQGDPWQRLVDALREEAGGDPNVLVDFLRSEDDVRIRSAIQVAAMQNQSSPALAAALAATVGHPTPHIRQEIALALSNYPAWPFDDLAGRLLEDVDSNVRSAAVWACKPRPALVSRLIERMHADDVPWIRQDIASILGDVEPALALPALLARLAVDDDTYVQQNCAASLERQFNRAGGVAGIQRVFVEVVRHGWRMVDSRWSRGGDQNSEARKSDCPLALSPPGNWSSRGFPSPVILRGHGGGQ